MGTDFLGHRARRIPPVLAFCVVLCAAIGVAAFDVVVTAGGGDQTTFHSQTINQFRVDLPFVDVVDVQTATTPLFHYAVAIVAESLGLTLAGAQIIGALFAAALAAITVAYSSQVQNPINQILAISPLVLSSYFWQSALWLNTDDAALLFGFSALILLVQHDNPSIPLTMGIGLLCASAIGTRQTSVWILLPVALAVAYKSQFWLRRVVRIGLAVTPGIAIAGLFVLIWGGLTPPRFTNVNATNLSPVAPSYGSAVLALFAVPIAISLTHRYTIRSWSVAVTVGVVAMLPALVFPSSATTSEQRRGGLVWSVVGQLPDIGERSPFLVCASFCGATAGALAVIQLPLLIRIITVSSFLSISAVAIAGSQLYQRYFELPIAALAVIVIVTAFRCRLAVRRWPLALIALLQLILTCGLVAIPILQELQD